MSALRLRMRSSADTASIQRWQNSALRADRGNVLDGGKGLRAALVIRHVVIEQRQVELDVQRFLVELAREIHARLRRIDVPIQADHEVVRDDRIAGGKESHQPLDEMPIRGRHALAQMSEIDLEIDLLDRPRVLDRRPIHLVEARVAHGPQRQIEARIEQVPVATARCPVVSSAALTGRPRSSADSRASRPPRSASGPCRLTVVFAICVAGRERR